MAVVRVFGLLLSCVVWACGQVTIIDTGSTNVAGMNVKLRKSGPQAMLELKDGSQKKVTLPKDMCARLMKDLKAAEPLNELPAAHCMKSVSFGTSLFIERNGVRSPDLSCPQADERSAALKKDATEIMEETKKQAPAGRGQVFR